MNVMDSSNFEREYDIGNKRADGKYNVWKREEVPGRGPDRDWVVLYVADSFKDALRWIRQRTRSRGAA